MKAVLTNCPHCLTRQLADETSVGQTVMCTCCQTVFTCEADSEYLQWVRPAMNKDNASSFEKYVSRVLFVYGIAVPVEKQDMVVEHIAEEVSPGHTIQVVFEVGENRFPVDLALFKNKRGEPALHFKWQGDSRIEQSIKALFPEAYGYYIESGGKKFLPDWVVVVGTSGEKGVFWLRHKRAPVPQTMSQQPIVSAKMPPPQKQAGLSQLIDE